ncbi:hypothetical protein M0Q50_07705 [bacterium]|jgi:Zn finger protein HypA/HybF involved in hydrogenase expression|nr:hypothetical protein [bacterium]
MISSYNYKKKSIRISYDDIIIRLFNKYGNKIILLTPKENYLGTHYKSEFKCNDCNTIFYQSVNKLLSNQYKGGCDNCIELNKKIISLEEVNKELLDKNIRIITTEQKLKLYNQYDFLCLNCNTNYKNSLQNVLNCKSCINCHRYDTNKIKILLNKNNKNIEILEESYISISKSSTFICKICNNKWNAKTHNVVTGFTGCPKCKKSKGEIYISNYLENKKIEYISQYIFNDCVNKRKLPFDFYLPDNNTCIEFDGYLHYYPWNNNDKSIEKFEKQKINDNIKNNYCKKNNITLLRIHYKDINNIEKILDNLLF